MVRLEEGNKVFDFIILEPRLDPTQNMSKPDIRLDHGQNDSKKYIPFDHPEKWS